MISANGVEYKNLPEQVQYLTERAAEFAVELDRVSASVDSVAGDVAALQTSYTALAEDVRVAKININSLFTNVCTAFSEIANIKNGTTPLFETITDSHGNKRFVEGDITMETITGVTQTYGKWSLSGTHLMIVLVFTTDANTALPSNRALAKIALPQFVLNKIIPLDQSDYVEQKVYYMRGKVNWWQSTYSLNIFLGKNPNYLYVSTTSAIPTINNDCVTRVQFDLLIDAS